MRAGCMAALEVERYLQALDVGEEAGGSSGETQLNAEWCARTGVCCLPPRSLPHVAPVCSRSLTLHPGLPPPPPPLRRVASLRRAREGEAATTA